MCYFKKDSNKSIQEPGGTDTSILKLAKIMISLQAKKCHNFPKLSRRINEDEYWDVVNYAEKLGFENGWTQDFISLSEEDLFIPDFNKKKVFKYYEK